MGKPKERGLVVEITSRQEAQAKGLTRYFTGLPCKRGHVAERFVSTRACAGCLAVHSAALSPDRRAVYRKKFRSSPFQKKGGRAMCTLASLVTRSWPT